MNKKTLPITASVLHIAVLLLFGTLARGQTPTIPTPQQTDQIITDPNSNGKADPGDRIRYKVTIQNTGTGNATGTQLNAVPDSRTTLDGASFRSSPVAVSDGPYTCTGNVGISVPAASGVKTNDFDDNLAGATLSVVTAPTNGSVALNNDGSFIYTPNAGYTGSDQFTYEITDVTPVSGHTPASGDIRGTVSITVSNLIWFIDNSSVAATSDGRRNTPFKTLAGFNAGSAAAGDVIYIEHTGTDYTGGIVLANGERLFGEGHTGGANLSNVLPFTLATHSIALPAINGSRPVITNSGGDGVTLTQDNTLRGFDVGACSDFGIENSGTASVGNLIVSEVSINNTTGGGFDASHGSGSGMNAVFGSISSSGGMNGINLGTCEGTFTCNGGTITNPSGRGVRISGGTVTFSTSGAITDNTGFAVEVDNHDSANGVTFSGNITSTGTGIRVQNCGAGTKLFSGSSISLSTGASTAVTLSSNTGATINFTGGGLVITTTSGKGFDATGGGTVNVTGTGNTISSTTGTALNVANTTIGASGLTFQSISHNGGTNGIVLNSTGSSGGLTVTGTGSANSGGTIQNCTEDGINLNSTAKFSLSYMNITANDGDGIGGSTVNGFKLDNCFITSNGDNAVEDESGIRLTELTGSAFAGANPTGLSNCTIQNNFEFQIVVENTSGVLTDFQMNNLSVSSTGASGVIGNLVSFVAFGTATMTLNAVGGTYTGAAPATATGIHADHSGTSGLVTANISNAMFINNNVAVSVSNAIGGNLAFDVNGNTATGNRSHGLNLFIAANATGSVNGKFRNNTVGTLNTTGSGSSLGFGIRVQNEGSASTANPVNVLIDNNTIQEMANFAGINVNLGISPQSFTRDAQLTITNNKIKEVDNNRGIIVQQNNSTAPGTVCANISGNKFTNVVGSVGDGTTIRLRQLDGGIFKVPQISSAEIQAENECLVGTCPTTQVSVGGTITFSQPACTQPTN